jgi:hypothetical protein
MQLQLATILVKIIALNNSQNRLDFKKPLCDTGVLEMNTKKCGFNLWWS